MGLCIYGRVVGRVALVGDTPVPIYSTISNNTNKRINKMKNKIKENKNKFLGMVV